MPTWLLTILLIAAIYRTTRLIVVDEFPPIRAPRDAATTWLDPTPEQQAENPQLHPHWGAFGKSIAYLLGCPWCMSAWVGAAVVWLATTATSVPMPVLVWAAASAATGLVAAAESEHEQRYRINELEIARREQETLR